jgi:2-C-methyl-D-erythritol 4-phosphate cytidylyltransferase/2-C-methyl-D-erythritol 2,4-cyclodiphosphate synthase
MTPASPATTVALIVAAGRGQRAGGALPKQYQLVGGEPVLARTLRVFLAHPRVDHVATVIHPDDAALYEAAAGTHAKLLPAVAGAETRQESVRRGLESLAAIAPGRVLIHDGARPFASAALIDRVLDALDDNPGALPALPVTDTLKRAEADLVAATVARDDLWAAQTPQGFGYEAIRAAHEAAARTPASFTDDASIAEWAGLAVKLVAGDAANVKLTTPEDIRAADARLSQELTDIRVGTGYDVHALGPGSGVTLGGILIPHDRSLVGHSDADVALHALTDAILGALAEGDIGDHFPPSDPQWRGADSSIFLAAAVARVRDRGGLIAHLDLAIIAETPRLAPHRDAMRTRIAAICGLDPGRVAVKATTNERLGFVGRGEGIAALATATVRLPP